MLDETSLKWYSAHTTDSDFYWVPRADKAFFMKRMQGPLVAAIHAMSERSGTRFKILEVGCGNGVDSVCLALLGHDVTGLDISEHLLAEAQRLSTVALDLFQGPSMCLRFVHGNALDLEEIAGQYDVVLSFGVTTIWRDEAMRMRALDNMRSVLKDEGWLVLGTSNTSHPFFKVIPMTDLVRELADHSLGILEAEVGKARFGVVDRGAIGLSESFEQWLRYGIFAAPLRLANYIFERLPTRLKLALAPHIFVVARKDNSGPRDDERPRSN